MATVASARRRGPVRGPTKPPNQTVEAFAEEMINGILCHYEPPDPGRHTSKNRSILRPPSFGANGRSRSDLITAMSNMSVTSNSSTATPPVKKKNVRWIDADDHNKSSSGAAIAARAIITAPVSRCSNAGNRVYDAGVDVGCLSPSSGGQGNNSNDILSPSDTTNGGGSTTIWSTISEESEIPCRRSRALKDAVFDEDGNPVSSRPGSNNNLPPPPLTPPPPRRKELFIPELCGVRINCFEDAEQMAELSRHPYGRPSPRRGHSVDYDDEDNSLTHEDERMAKSSGDRRKRSSTSSRSRRLSSSSSSSSIPVNINEPRDSDSVEPSDEGVDIKSDGNRKSNHTLNNNKTNGDDAWQVPSSPPATGSSNNARPNTYGPPETINQASNPGNVIDPVMMSRALSEVNVPQDRPQKPQLQKQQQKQQPLEVVKEDDDWDQSIPIVPSLSDPPPVKDEETQTSPTETSANKSSSSSKEKSKIAKDKVKKETTGSIERAKARAAEKIKKAEERKKSEEKKAAAKQKKIDEKKREAEERRRAEGSKETKLSERAAEDLRKIEDAKRTTEDLKHLEQLRIDDVSKLAKQVRRTEENILREERRRDEELKKADELRKIEEKKIAEELKRAEEIRADAMRRAEALMKLERAKEATLLKRLEAARNADLQKLSDIDPTDSLGYYADIASHGSVILSTELAQGQSSSSGIRPGRQQEPRKSADDKDSRRRSFDPLLLMRRNSRSRSPGRSKSPRRSKSPIRPGLFRRRQTIDSVAYDDEYITSSASKSYSPGNSDAGLNDYGLKTRSFGTASTATDAERDSYVNAHRESVESNMQVRRQVAARAQRDQYLGHPRMPHLHPAHPLNQYRQKGQHGRDDEILERQSFITAHRQGFDPTPSRMDDDSMDRQSFITAHREGFEVFTSRPPLDDDRESFITDHRRGFESQNLKRLGGATPPIAQPDFVVETAMSGDDSMGLTSPISVGSTGSASAGSTSIGSASMDLYVPEDDDHTIPEPPKVRPTLTPPKEEAEKKEEEMTWEEKTRLAWERIRNGFGLTTTEEITEEVPALKASEDSGDTAEEKKSEQADEPKKEVSESGEHEINATPQKPPLSPRISPGHSPNVSPSRRRSMSSPCHAMGKLFQSSAPREQLPPLSQQQQRPKGILKTPTPEKRVTFGHDSEKIFADDQDENKPSPRPRLSSPMNAHVHPHIQHGQMYMPHSHGPHPAQQQQQQPLQPQPHLQQPMGTPPIDKKKVKRVFRGTKLITHIFKTKSPQRKSSPRGSKSPRGRSPLRGVSPHQQGRASPSPTPPHLRMAGLIGGTASASLDSTITGSGGSSYHMNAYPTTTSDAPAGTIKPGAGNYNSLAAVQQTNGMSPLGSSSYSVC